MRGSPRLAAALASGVALLIAAGLAPDVIPAAAQPYNIVVVITDDQAAGAGIDAAAMPWLHAQIADPSTGWVSYDDAVVSTPMCCPSRATILTGRTAMSTGVVDNHTGWRLDESHTLATRLQDAGYETALIGKYLNEYPWDRGPYVPPGWDRWFAKINEALDTTYYGYPVIDDGAVRQFGRGPGDYVTDVLGREALAFVRAAPVDRPWFLVFAPPAPHAPWTPAPRHEGDLEGLPTTDPPPVPSDALAWMRAVPPLGPAALERLSRARVRAGEAMLAVDEHLHALADAIAARGAWDRTVVLFLSDNGMHFGERGWVGKRVPYEPSIRVPFVVRWPPGLSGSPASSLVSNLDIAPTVADLAGLAPEPSDGLSLLADLPGDRAVPLWWVGDDEVPGWRGVRTADAVLIEWSTGERELFDLSLDPAQDHDLIGDPAWAEREAALTALLP